ncbi:hypothetical protein [Escherichia coli]|nr:hypothetical protein [Escherichia coli]
MALGRMTHSTALLRARMVQDIYDIGHQKDYVFDMRSKKYQKHHNSNGIQRNAFVLLVHQTTQNSCSYIKDSFAKGLSQKAFALIALAKSIRMNDVHMDKTKSHSRPEV